MAIQEAKQVEMKQVQKNLLQLCEKQKLAFANLRKTIEAGQSSEVSFKIDRKRPLPAGALLSAKISAGQLHSTQIIKKSAVQPDGSIKIPQQALAVRTLGGQTKLLIPFSPANAKKGGQQIFVVPSTATSNGTRLTTTATMANPITSMHATGQKASLIKSIVVDTNSNTSKAIIQRALQSSNSTTKVIASFSPSSTTATISSNANTSTTPGQSLLSSNVSKSILAIKSSNNQSIVNGSPNSSSGSFPSRNGETESKAAIKLNVQSSVKPDEETIREIEIKYKEEFFAALGLVTKKALHELQNKKGERKRRTTANPHFSNAAIEAKRISAMELAAKKAKKREQLLAANKNGSPTSSTRSGGNGKRVFLSTNRGKDVTETNSNRSNTSGKSVESKRATGVSRSSANAKQSIEVTNVNGSAKVLSNCFICEELCESDVDAVANCKFCKCVFHATCACAVEKIMKTMTVACPKCNHHVRLANSQMTSHMDKEFQDIMEDCGRDDSRVRGAGSQSNTSNGRRKVKATKSGNKKTATKTTTTNSTTITTESGSDKPTDVVNPTEPQTEEERKNLLLRQINLNKKLQDYKKRLQELNAKLETSNQKQKTVTTRRDATKKEIERLIHFVRDVQENPEQKENCNTSEPEENKDDENLHDSKETDVVPSTSEMSVSITTTEVSTLTPPVTTTATPTAVEALHLPKLNPIISEASNSGTDPVDLVESFMRCDEREIPAKRLKFESFEEFDKFTSSLLERNSCCEDDLMDVADETSAAVASIQIDL